jgi:hypothetical protein
MQQGPVSLAWEISRRWRWLIGVSIALSAGVIFFLLALDGIKQFSSTFGVPYTAAAAAVLIVSALFGVGLSFVGLKASAALFARTHSFSIEFEDLNKRIEEAQASTLSGFVQDTSHEADVAGIRIVRERLLQFLISKLDGLAARERLAMIRAERFADRLSTIGTLMLVLSVFAPVASAVLYATLEPLEVST